MFKLDVPVKIGQILYANFGARQIQKKPYKVKVWFIGLHICGGYFKVVYCDKSRRNFNFEDIGKYIFYTCKEAEKALKEMEEENE